MKSGFQKGNQCWKLVKSHSRLFGDLNPARRPEVRAKISKARKGLSTPALRKSAIANIVAYNKAHSGSNHYAWIKDRTKLKKKQIRNDSAYGYWRRMVWLRDNFKCKIGDSDCKGRIEAHHILSWTNYPKLRYEINNGITLCHYHHPRKRTEENRLSPYFQELLTIK